MRASSDHSPRHQCVSLWQVMKDIVNGYKALHSANDDSALASDGRDVRIKVTHDRIALAQSNADKTAAINAQLDKFKNRVEILTKRPKADGKP
jgi:hypothetical protein